MSEITLKHIFYPIVFSRLFHSILATVGLIQIVLFFDLLPDYFMRLPEPDISSAFISIMKAEIYYFCAFFVLVMIFKFFVFPIIDTLWKIITCDSLESWHNEKDFRNFSLQRKLGNE